LSTLCINYISDYFLLFLIFWAYASINYNYAGKDKKLRNRISKANLSNSQFSDSWLLHAQLLRNSLNKNVQLSWCTQLRHSRECHDRRATHFI
jgi:hypothetical protein